MSGDSVPTVALKVLLVGLGSCLGPGRCLQLGEQFFDPKTYRLKAALLAVRACLRHCLRQAAMLLACSCTILDLSLCATVAASADRKQNVLILVSRHSQQPAYELFARSFHAALRTDRHDRLELFTEFLDLGRFPQPEHKARMLAFLRDKYAATSIDLMVSVSPYALEFLVEHRIALFPRVPTERAKREEVTDALTDIAEDAKRASQIIHRLRTLFRKEHFEQRPVEVNELAEDVVSLVRHDLERQHILIRRAFEPVPPVLGDFIQLQQVLLNLLVNACEAIIAAADGPREIAIVTTARVSGLVEIAIRDTGIGVKEAELERIFERFVSTNATIVASVSAKGPMVGPPLRDYIGI